MLVDLATCEWSPGSNRSLVPASVAVARLDVPAADRPILVERLRRLSSFDDVVRIDWISIRSAQPAYQYAPTIRNMNFGPTGRLCRTVTRDAWKSGDVQEALVFVVNGRAYGFAAACGNLFELSLLPPAAPPAALVPGMNLESASPISPDFVRSSSAVEAFSPPTPQGSVETAEAGPFGAPWAVAPLPTFDASPGFFDVPELPPVSAVPEPSILKLLIGTWAAWFVSNLAFATERGVKMKLLLRKAAVAAFLLLVALPMFLLWCALENDFNE